MAGGRYQPPDMGASSEQVSGDSTGDTCRISRWINFKAAAVAGGRYQPPYMGASSEQDHCGHRHAGRKSA